MGAQATKLITYWNSETDKPSSTSGHEDQPTCDPKNANGDLDESGDEDTRQEQGGGNLDNKEPEIKKELDEDNIAKDNHDQEHCVSSANGAGDDIESDEVKSEEVKNAENITVVEIVEDTMVSKVKVTNGDSKATTSPKSSLKGSESSHLTPLEQAKAAYNANKHSDRLIHSRPNQLTVESRKRDRSADSDRSNPSYQNTYLHDLAVGNLKKRTKSSETDSVSSSRSDRASMEIEVITPKPSKSRKRRAKPAKKYVS